MSQSQPGNRRFATTRWSMVLAAGNLRDPQSRLALEELCRTYWAPVYAFVRRRGFDGERSRDLVQAFFTRLLEKESLAAAQPERGRFRSFLLASAKNFLANEWDREQALKRGGDRTFVPLDLEDPVYRRLEPSGGEPPDRIFEQRWAMAVVESVWLQLESEFESKSHRRFQRIKGFVAEFGEQSDYAAAARDLETTEHAIKTAVYRLRKRFGVLLRAKILETVASPQEVEDEIRFLLGALRP